MNTKISSNDNHTQSEDEKDSDFMVRSQSYDPFYDEMLATAEIYQQAQKAVENVDKIFRRLAPFLFFIFNILYWVFFLIICD